MSTPPRKPQGNFHRLDPRGNAKLARENARLQRLYNEEPDIPPKYNEFGNEIPQYERYLPKLGQNGLLFNMDPAKDPGARFRRNMEAYKARRAAKILATMKNNRGESRRRRANRKTRRSKN